MDLRALHAKLTRTELASAIDTLAAQNDTDGLLRPEWGRVVVTWTRDVQTLLDAGLLSLDDAPPPPHIPTHEERRRAAYRRYRAKRRANGGLPLGTIPTRSA